MRSHADIVFDKIIAPALQRASVGGAVVSAVRGDHISSQGKVLPQVIDAILEYDIIIAVLSFSNPNVFYELGIAHSAGRPVILLQHDQQHVPFNIHGHRFVEYRDSDLQNHKSRHRIGGPIDILTHMCRDALSAPVRVRPFDRAQIVALNEPERSTFVLDRFSEINLDDYSEMIGRAQMMLAIASTTTLEFTRADRRNYRYAHVSEPVTFFDLVGYKLRHEKVALNVLMMHPDNPGLPEMITLKRGQPDVEHVRQVREALALAQARWSNFRDSLVADDPSLHDRFCLRRLRRGMVYSRITMTEHEAVISPNYYQLGTSAGGPSIYARAGTRAYEVYHDELRYLTSIAEELHLTVREAASPRAAIGD